MTVPAPGPGDAAQPRSLMPAFDSRRAGVLAGLVLFAGTLAAPVPAGATPQAMRAAAVTLLMAAWWVTEAIPISATAMVPLALFPLLGILDAAKTAENYGHNYVLMLLGGFFLAAAIERQSLHRRFALLTIRLLGTSRSRVLLSFMVATAFLSMWIANVAVALLMLPIGMAVVGRESPVDGDSRFGIALMLGITYAASVGGMATLIGTPTNLVFAGLVRTLYPGAPEVSFLQWMAVGLPLALLLLPVTWWYLRLYFGVRGSIPGTRDVVDSELRALGPMTSGERRVLAVFVLTALGWIFRRSITMGSLTIPGWASALGVDATVHDATVAIAAALSLFLIPTGARDAATGSRSYLLDWASAERVPWGVVLIVGGGYAIAAGMTATGLGTWIGGQITFVEGLPTFLVLLIVVVAVTFLTEVNSNTATANMFLPVLATVAVVNGAHPFLLMVPATFACSCAFCMPSGTGTNAVVFASGRISIPVMARAGLLMNLIAIVVVTAMVYLVAVPVFGLAGPVPAWAR